MDPNFDSNRDIFSFTHQMGPLQEGDPLADKEKKIKSEDLRISIEMKPLFYQLANLPGRTFIDLKKEFDAANGDLLEILCSLPLDLQSTTIPEVEETVIKGRQEAWLLVQGIRRALINFERMAKKKRLVAKGSELKKLLEIERIHLQTLHRVWTAISPQIKSSREELGLHADLWGLYNASRIAKNEVDYIYNVIMQGHQWAGKLSWNLSGKHYDPEVADLFS